MTAHENMSTFCGLDTVTVKSKDWNRLKQLALAEDTTKRYFTITFWNHLKYLNYLYATLSPPSIFLFVFVVLGSDVFAVYYPQSAWYRVYILSLEHSREAHAQSSFNICSNPCSSCRLNGSYVWYFSSLLLLMRRFRCAAMSHTHLSFQCKKLSFCNAQTATKYKMN